MVNKWVSVYMAKFSKNDVDLWLNFMLGLHLRIPPTRIGLKSSGTRQTPATLGFVDFTPMVFGYPLTMSASSFLWRGV